MVGYILMCLLAVFIGIVAARTACFTPKPQPALSEETVAFDKAAAVDALSQLVRCRTISYNDHSLEDDAEFEKLLSLLPTLYPRVFDTC